MACTAFIAAGGAADAHLYLMLVGPDGQSRLAGGPLRAEPHRERFLLRDMGGMPETGTPRGTIRLGVWTGGAPPIFDVEGFRLVRLRVRPRP